MQATEIEDLYAKINSLLSSRRIVEAIGMLNYSMQHLDMGEHILALNNLDDTYQNMLKYTIVMGIKDPQRQHIQDNLVHDLFELSDHLRYKILLQSTFHLNITGISDRDLQSKQSYGQIEEIISTLFLHNKLDDILQDSEISGDADNVQGFTERQRLLARLFGLLYASCKLSPEAMRMVNKLMQSENITWYEKSVVISAITLGLIKGFDAGRF
ncbi:MAG: hypothetical protein Q7V19_02630, partial [Bacteroidales bacterium]|nr:hypothetical protein [Bacteroidales bacterium]